MSGEKNILDLLPVLPRPVSMRSPDQEARGVVGQNRYMASIALQIDGLEDRVSELEVAFGSTKGVK